jgi:hypothetical protein
MLRLPEGTFALAVMLALVAACGDDDTMIEQPAPTSVPSQPTATPTVANPDVGIVVTPPPPLPTPIVIPSDWPTYRSAESGIAVRYPSDWLVRRESDSIFSFNPDSAPNVNEFAAGGIKISILRVPLSAPGVGPRPPEATDTTLSSQRAWETVHLTSRGRTHAIVTELNGYRYSLVGRFADPNAPEEEFLRIASTFAIV